jgi:protein TonB
VVNDPFEEDRGDARVRAAAIFAAALVHAVFLFFYVDANATEPIEIAETERPSLATYRPAPPPPRVRPQKPQRRKKQFSPIPDPEPDNLEPIVEDDSLPELDEVDLTLDFIDQPVAPRATVGEGEPLPLGTAGVTPPILIASTQVKPRYPDPAQAQRENGVVLLLAVVTAKGDVERIKILREPATALGFGPAAIAAVQQWKYIPAMKDGQPVPVFMNVTVRFALYAY